MLAIEVIASSMFLVVSLILCGVALTRLLDRVVLHTHARIARIEAQSIDEKYRQITE